MGLSKEQRTMNLLGMAQRAGRMASGGVAVEQAVKGKKARYLLVAEDAAAESKKSYKELADRYGIPCSVCLTKELLGSCLGKEYRAAAAVLDEGFSAALGKLWNEGEN